MGTKRSCSLAANARAQLATVLNYFVPSFSLLSSGTITDVGATVAGTIDNGKLETVWSVEYGLTNAYGSTATGGTINAVTAVSKALTGLTPFTLYYWRLKAVNSKGTTYSEGQTLTTVEPAIISDANTVAWYDFATGITKDGSNFVSAWNSRIGTNHLAQATGTNQPLFTAAGVLFDGVDNYMQSPDVALTQPNFVYIVLNQKNWAATDCIISTAGLIRQDIATPGIRIYAGSFIGPNNNLALNTYGILRALFNGASSKIIINATSPTTGNVGAGTGTYISIGCPPAGIVYGNFEVKEIIIRKIADDSTNETAIYNYLKNKYSL